MRVCCCGVNHMGVWITGSCVSASTTSAVWLSEARWRKTAAGTRTSWTGTPARHAGVALCPKDLRSSYITWLRSEANTDAVLKSAAFAMRHSPAQAAGVARGAQGTPSDTARRSGNYIHKYIVRAGTRPRDG